MLDLLEESDTLHAPYRPTAFTLHPDLTIHGAYDGYWYWGRPTMEDLRQDMREISRIIRGLSAPMSNLPHDAAWVAYDGSRLSKGRGPGRVFLADARCFAGAPVLGAHAQVCAVTDPDAALPSDHPEVQQVLRDALAWWIPMLGDNLVCLTTLALDETLCGGAITVTRTTVSAIDDPFARIFPARSVCTDLFCPVAPPPGPAIERYAGVPWPGGSFA